MNIVKNMEAVFIAALATAAFATYATADITPAPKAAAAVSVPAEVKIATVVVTTKRLTAEEKARLGS